MEETLTFILVLSAFELAVVLVLANLPDQERSSTVGFLVTHFLSDCGHCLPWHNFLPALAWSGRG